MKKSLILIVLCFTFYQGLAQQYTINGKVIDDQHQPIAYVNMLLLKAADSTLVKGAVSEENGNYIFASIDGGQYLLKASFVGYADTYSSPFTVSSDQNIGFISMPQTEESLEAVMVTGRKPTIQRKVDRMVFNVENTVVSSGNTLDILKRTPGVIVSQGQIMVRNSPAVVYINDRKVYLTSEELQQLLEGFSGENVKSVEVITTPPAKYDAEGGAILNIVTSKNLSIGYKGSINGAATVAILPKYTLGTSHYYKNKWLNAYASYTLNTRLDLKRDEDQVRFFNPDDSENSIWRTDFRRETRTLSHNLNTILDFTLDEKNTLSFSANLQFTPTNDSEISGLTNIYNPQHTIDSLYTTTGQKINEQNNLLFNLDYVRQLGDNGATFSAKANFIHYNDDRRQDVATRYSLPSGDLLNKNSFLTFPMQKTDIYTGQADYSGKLGGISFVAGAKYSGIDSKSSQDYFDTGVEPSAYIPGLSDTFNYNENIYAAYFSLNKEWAKWSAKLGLRGEYTDADGNSLTLGKVNTQQYFEPFPTFYLTYTPGENSTYGFNYSRRISRPRFESLNPFRTYINENNFSEGNPNIQPSIINKVELNYTYKNKLFFYLYYDRAEDETAVFPFQNNRNRILRSVNANSDFSDQYSLDIVYAGYITDWWYFNVNSSFFTMKTNFFALENDNQIVTNRANGVFLQTLSYLTLTKDRTFSADVSTYFISDITQGSYSYGNPPFGLNIGLRKTFLKGRLTATVDVNDILNTMNFPLESKYLDQDFSFFARPESRTVRFGVLYKFGNFKLSDNERSTDIEESERLKAKQAGGERPHP